MTEEETGAASERESRRRSLSDKGWLWLQGYSITIVGIVAVVWIYGHPNEKNDAQGIIIGLLGFLAVIIGGIYTASKNANRVLQTQNEVLQSQNKDLSEIKGKVNGNVERLLAEQAQKHFAELQAHEAQAKEERHKRDGTIGVLQAALVQAETELKLIHKQAEQPPPKGS